MTPETPNLHTNGPATVTTPAAVAAETNPRVTLTAHRFEVKPMAGPNGFRWFVQALTYPMTKSGSPGEPTTLMGTPKRQNVAGPFATREIAESFLPVPR